MRGGDGCTETMFTMAKLDDLVPANRRLRPIRLWLSYARKRMNGVFARMYASDAKGGRPSIAPEKLIRALLLQVLYSIRCERMLMEQISYNMLFRWFFGSATDDAVWDHSTFSKNRDWLVGARCHRGFVQRDGGHGACTQSSRGRALQRRRHVDLGAGEP